MIETQEIFYNADFNKVENVVISKQNIVSIKKVNIVIRKDYDLQYGIWKEAETIVLKVTFLNKENRFFTLKGFDFLSEEFLTNEVGYYEI